MGETNFPYITDPIIRAYCERYSTNAKVISEAIETSTEQTGRYVMASGQYLGKFLKMMAKVIRPQVILELGTFTGYGTLCLRAGLPPEGKIYTVEKAEEYYKLSEQNISTTGDTTQITQLLGDANEVISNLDVEIDMVFMDAAKKQYGSNYDLIFPKLRPGGVILADNVLWKGKIGHPDNDKLGLALDAFNKKIYEDDRVDNIILPIDDGVNFIIKK